MTVSFLGEDSKGLVLGDKSCSITQILLAVRPSTFSCKMVGLRYELALVLRPKKDVLYPPFRLNAFGNPRGRGSIPLPPRECDGLTLFVTISLMVLFSF